MSLEQKISTLVTSSNALTEAVDGKMGEIDKKTKDSIVKVESAYDKKATELTIIATDGYKKAIEHNSGGRNTVIYDAQGNPNIMCVIPRFNIEDLGLVDLNLGTGTHSAFVTNGVPRGEILIGKYTASTAPNGSAVIGGAIPRTSVNYDTAKELCTRKGENWHLMSIHEWAVIALWSLANGTVPRGNTNKGRSHEKKWETARRRDNSMPGDVAGDWRTRTGTGPITWSHDHSGFGICDLVGNVWEWQDQMKLNDGQIITTLDNNPAIAEAHWHKHAAYFDSPIDNQDIEKRSGSPILSNAVINRNGPSNDNSASYGTLGISNFSAITKARDYEPNKLLRQLLIESASEQKISGYMTIRNYGERYALRGGGGGLGSIYLGHTRSIANGGLGFRPAFFV